MATDETAPPWQTWGGLVLPALTFLVGLALGLVLMFAVGDGGPDSAAEPAPSPSEPTATSGDTVVTVPAACEAAAENISEATRLLDDIAGSVRDFQPQELVERLNRLEDLDVATRPLAERCSQVSVTQEPAPSESSEPTESS